MTHCKIDCICVYLYPYLGGTRQITLLDNVDYQIDLNPCTTTSTSRKCQCFIEVTKLFVYIVTFEKPYHVLYWEIVEGNKGKAKRNENDDWFLTDKVSGRIGLRTH